MRNLQMPGRSSARARQAMAATSHPLATQAALAMMKAGGNAIDAAIAAAAVQAVVEPQSTGIGGDCFAIISKGGSDELIALNASGRAPQAATIEAFRTAGIDGDIPLHNVHAISMPGAVAGWCRLIEDHGTLSLSEVLAPAIHYAENGYVVEDRVSFDWANSVPALSWDPAARAHFLKDGAPYKAGDVHDQNALAGTLRSICDAGHDGFYRGPVAEAMVAHLQGLGGLHTLSDFAEVKADYVTPISTIYRGYQVHELPPNNQGITALMMLNMLSGYDVASWPELSGDRFHMELEAGRLAYRDRNAFLGELPDGDGTVSALLNPARAAVQRAEIDMARRMTHLPEIALDLGDTVYISVVDADRNAVSFINSVFHSFGSGAYCPQSGVLFQNRGASFRMDPDHPNALAPGKRPMHTIMPGMLTKGGKAVMPFGVMGGDYQPFGQTHFLMGLLDYGRSPQEALDAPRVFFDGEEVLVEDGIPPETVASLQEKGHQTRPAHEPLGGGQAIWIDWDNGTLTGGSDPRKDGLALGY